MEHTPPIPTWVRAAQQGDTDSFGRLVETYSGAVLAAAYSRLGDMDASEDIRQDAFLLGYERLKSLRNPAAFGSWIRAITLNLCRHWQRSQIYRRRLLESATLSSTATESDNPDTHSDAQTVNDVLRGAMEKLRPDDREALLLFYFEGKSVAESAGFLNISEIAMRKRLHRARVRLRDALSGRVEDELRAWAREKNAARKVLLALPAGSAIGKDTSAANALIAGQGGLLGQVLAHVTPVQWAMAGAAAIALATAVALTATYEGDSPASATPPPPPVAQAVPAAPAASATDPAPTESVVAIPTAADTAVSDEPGTSYIRGAVIDEDGSPVVDATVELRAAKPEIAQSDPAVVVVATTSSDGDGAFAFGDLANGRYLVYAEKAGLAIAGYETSISTRNPIREGLVLRLRSPGTLIGTVVDASGRPVAGAAVAVYDFAPPLRLREDEAFLEEFEHYPYGGAFGAFIQTTTDTDGGFVLDSLPKEFVVSHVMAHKPGFAPSPYWTYDPPEEWRTAPTTAHPARRWRDGYALVGGDPITIAMREGVTLRGTVVDGRTGSPAAGARVTAYTDEATNRSDHFGRAFHYASTETDADGTYVLADVSPLPTGLFAAHDQLLSTPQRLLLNNDQHPEPIDLVLHPPARIEGTVVDSLSGKPVAGASLFLQDGISDRFVSGATDTRGRFALDGIAAGEVSLTVRGDLGDLDFDPSRHNGAKGFFLKLALEPGEQRRNETLFVVNSRDQIDDPLSIHVVDGRGRPVPHATIHYDPLAGRFVTADAEGRYRWERIPQAGQAYVAINPATEEIGYADINYTPGIPVPPVTIVADIATGKVAGVATMTDGAAFEPGLRVVFKQSYSFRSSTAIDKNGAFTSPPLAPGTYEVSMENLDLAAAVAWSPESTSVRVVAGSTTDAGAFAGTPMAGRIAGWVRRPDGSPVPKCTVRARRGSLQRVAVTDSAGAFVLDQLAGSDFVVTAGIPPGEAGGDYGDWTALTDMEAGVDDLEIILAPCGRLAGAVVLTEAERDAIFQPTSGSAGPVEVRVTWERENENYHWTMYFWQQAFDIPVPPGSYDLSVRVASPAHNVSLRSRLEAIVASGALTDFGAIELHREE